MIVTYLAQNFTIQNSGASSATTIKGPLAINSLADLINRLNIFIIPLASIILFGVLVWGGYDFLMSGGSDEKISAGKAKITTALIGFILLVFSYFFTTVVATIFGLGGK